MPRSSASPVPTGKLDPTLPGFFGKMAMRGDFVSRRIDAATRTVLDEWLSASVVTSRQVLGQQWLQAYLTAPVWRFAIAAGVVGPEAVAGVMMASLDSSGRHFPLVLLGTTLGSLPFRLYRTAEDWFDAAEKAVLSTRAQATDLETFDVRVAALGGPSESLAAPVQARRLALDDGREIGTAYESVLEAALAESEAALSLWWTRGGGAVASSMLLHQGLPSPDRFAAMLDGRWGHWGWSEAQTPRRSARPAAQKSASSLRSAARTHRGTSRSRNEDAALEQPDRGLWAVADGAGGHDAAAYASAVVISKLGEFMPAMSFSGALTEIEELLGEANDALRARGRQFGPERMVAAVVVVLFIHRGRYAVIWAGDSRVYLLRDGDLVRLTRDHVTEDVRYVTQAIGATEMLMVDVARGDAMPGDRFVLCSDGLVKAIGEPMLDAAARRGTAAEAAIMLIDDALIAGARDNVTALVVDVVAS